MRLSKLHGRFTAATKERDGRSCLQVINEEIAVTNKEGNPEESFVQDLPDSRGTELCRVVRILRSWPMAADYILLIYPRTGASCRRKIRTVPRNN